MTLAEFLLARIAEDEESVRSNWHRDGVTDERWWGTPFQPSRVLAECEAKRRIVEGLAYVLRYEPEYDHAALNAQHYLRLLALPYADHPDYRKEWTP